MKIEKLRKLGYEKSPIPLRFFAPVMESKKNGECFCIDQLLIFEDTVGCSENPGAANLQDIESWQLKTFNFQTRILF